MDCVWHCLNSDGGGVARYVEQLAQAQAQLGAPSADRMQVTGPPGLSLPVGVRHHRYQPERRIWGLNQWRFAALSPGRVCSSRCILHTHNFTFAKPGVHTIHGLYTAYRRPWFEQNSSARSFRHAIKLAQYFFLCRLEKRILLKANRVVFVSTENRHFAEEQLGVRRPDNFQVILPGVDVTRYHPRMRDDRRRWRREVFPELDPDRRWLLFAGLDFCGKGLLRLLKALVSQGPRDDSHLLVFGEDAANQMACEALARQAAPAQVQLMGRDPRLPQAHQLSDCLVMDSVAEGFPLVLLEAMASGSVPVVTNFGGVSDVVTDGLNGLVCQDAALVVQQALALPPDRLRALSDESVKTASQRTWAHVAAEYAECYALVRRGK